MDQRRGQQCDAGLRGLLPAADPGGDHDGQGGRPAPLRPPEEGLREVNN